MGNETFSRRWQVAHSNVRTSTPRSPAEIRANPILCLQTGHIGRSAMELELRISHHPSQTIRAPAFSSLYGHRLWGNFLTRFPGATGTTPKHLDCCNGP